MLKWHGTKSDIEFEKLKTQLQFTAILIIHRLTTLMKKRIYYVAYSRGQRNFQQIHISGSRILSVKDLMGVIAPCTGYDVPVTSSDNEPLWLFRVMKTP